VGLGYGEPQFAWQERLFRGLSGALANPALQNQLGARLLYLSRPSADFEFVGNAGPAFVHRNPAALPRALCVERVVSASGLAEVVHLVSLREFDPREAVLVEGPTSVASVTGRAAPCRARLVAESPNRLVFDVHSEVARPFVVFDTWAPGWTARVNGHVAVIHRANATFRMVEVPAGSSRVEFAYEPPGLRAGAWLSLLGLMAFLAVGWRSRPVASGEAGNKSGKRTGSRSRVSV